MSEVSERFHFEFPLFFRRRYYTGYISIDYLVRPETKKINMCSKPHIFDYGTNLMFEVKTYGIEAFGEKSDEPVQVENVWLEIYKDGNKVYSDSLEEFKDKDGQIIYGKYFTVVDTENLPTYGDYEFQIIALEGNLRNVEKDYLKLN